MIALRAESVRHTLRILAQQIRNNEERGFNATAKGDWDEADTLYEIRVRLKAQLAEAEAELTALCSLYEEVSSHGVEIPETTATATETEITATATEITAEDTAEDTATPATATEITATATEITAEDTATPATPATATEIKRLAISITKGLDLSPALKLDLVACHPEPSRALLVRALLVRGLNALEEGAELPEHEASSERLSVSVPLRLDASVYAVACAHRSPMASTAARLVRLGLSTL